MERLLMNTRGKDFTRISPCTNNLTIINVVHRKFIKLHPRCHYLVTERVQK